MFDFKILFSSCRERAASPRDVFEGLEMTTICCGRARTLAVLMEKGVSNGLTVVG